MIYNLGLPYMGSKRKLSHKIVNKILRDNQKTEYFYDVFGGGGAISFYALQLPQIKQVFYNEFNTGIVELLKKIQKDGLTDEFYQWIDRDTFEKYKNIDDWFGGLVKVVWSFGNNQSGYMYGKDIEQNKHLLHNIVVNKCDKSLKEFNKKYNCDIEIPIKNDLFGDDFSIDEIRLQIINNAKKEINRQAELKHLERLQRLQHLEALQRLQHLERLQQFKNLNISNLSYEQVKITTPIDKTVIYLDPPYKDTGKYQKDINHDKLKEYIHNSPYKIYLSSYENVYNMELVTEFEHRSSLSVTANNKVTERLYTIN